MEVAKSMMFHTNDLSVKKATNNLNCNVIFSCNGGCKEHEGVGNVKLFNKESQALYMPTFTSNLLYVKKATNDLNCNVIFSRNGVCFQDIETSKMLEKGVRKGELYLLEDTKISDLSYAFNFASVLANDVLWHARLGHPQSRALSLMLHNLSFKNKTYEVCILGKHYKTFFPKSVTVYENCFDFFYSYVCFVPCVYSINYNYFFMFIYEIFFYICLFLI